MIKKLVHFSDLHLKLFKDHDLYRLVLTDMLDKFREIKPDRITFSGDLLHSKNQSYVSYRIIQSIIVNN